MFMFVFFFFPFSCHIYVRIYDQLITMGFQQHFLRGQAPKHIIAGILIKSFNFTVINQFILHGKRL